MYHLSASGVLHQLYGILAQLCKMLLGQCSWASPKRTCSPGKWRTAEQSRPRGPWNPQPQNNGPGPVIIPWQIQLAPPFRILGPPLWMQHPSPANPPTPNNAPPRGPAIPQAQNNPPSAANPHGYNNPRTTGPENPRAPNVQRLGHQYCPPPANISEINPLPLQMFIPGMPVQVQHAPANVQAQNNPHGALNS